MGMYEELDEETVELLLRSLAERRRMLSFPRCLK